MSDIVKDFRKTVCLGFPPDISDRPVVCNLTRHFDLSFSILQAKISPRKEGQMTLEISGSEENYRKGMSYLKEKGVKVVTAAQKITRVDESCMHCGLCTAMCPAKALSVEPESRIVIYDADKCTACGICTRLCPVRAMRGEVDENGFI